MSDRYTEPHDHLAEHCICWVMGPYAIAVCKGTCHDEASQDVGTP